jgi:hypothetical protein
MILLLKWVKMKIDIVLNVAQRCLNHLNSAQLVGNPKDNIPNNYITLIFISFSKFNFNNIYYNRCISLFMVKLW